MERIHMTALQERSRRQRAVDAAAGVGVAGAQVGFAYGQAAHRGGVVTAGDVVLLAVGGLVLVARRSYPVTVMVAVYGIALAFQATQHFGPERGSVWLSVIVAFATAIYFRRRVAAVVFLVVCYVVSLWGPSVLGDGRAPSAVFALSLGAGLAVLLTASELVRLRRQRALVLAQGKRQEALRQASEERLQVARDLHDVVAHNISVINVQANTALHLLDRQPERARIALTTINEVSKHALVELRSILGVLRDVDEQAPRAPSPSLAHLEDLLTNVGASGLAVRVEENGEARPLPTEIDLAAYRIVQEALTNSTRHSGATSAVVRIAYGKDEVVVEVEDNGCGRNAEPTNGSGSGSGIAGMTERAVSMGGTVDARNRPDGVFRVRACLPVDGPVS